MAAGCLYHRQCRSQERGNESDVYRRRVRTYGQNTGRKYSSRAPRDLNLERVRAGWMKTFYNSQFFLEITTIVLKFELVIRTA